MTHQPYQSALNSQPQPVHITVSVVDRKPEPPSLPAKAIRKQATSERIKKEISETKSVISGLLSTYGATGKPGSRSTIPSANRGWSSLNPNEAYLNSYVSEYCGGQEAHEEAVACCQAFCRNEIWDKTLQRFTPVSIQPLFVPSTANVETSGTRGEPPAVSPEMARAVATKKMTRDGINAAYVAYLSNPEREWGNLSAAVYAYAPKQGRREQCLRLLNGKPLDIIEADDIIGDFASDLLDRFQKGQYHSHTNKFHHWIGHVWGKWFFAEFKTDFFKRANFTVSVDEDEYDNEDEREVGTVYRTDVDGEIAARHSYQTPATGKISQEILRQLDCPNSRWGKLSDAAKRMIRVMAGVPVKKEAQAVAKLSEGYKRRLRREIRACATEEPASNIICIQACADDTREVAA